MPLKVPLIEAVAIARLEDELAHLPLKSAFGSSNADEIKDIKTWLADLKAPTHSNQDVIDWLAGKWSPISDFF